MSSAPHTSPPPSPPLSQEALARLHTPHEARALTQEAVSDPALTQALSAQAHAWLTEGLTEGLKAHRALALHLTRALCLRPLLPLTLEALKAGGLEGENPLHALNLEAREALEAQRARQGDGVSRFVEPALYVATPHLPHTALSLLLELTPRAHPRYAEALSWASERLSLLSSEAPLTLPLLRLVWGAWPAERPLLELAPHLSALLRDEPAQGSALATRLALFHPEHALEVCEALASALQAGELSSDTLTPLMSALEKQLLRVGKVKIWAHCRRALRGS